MDCMGYFMVIHFVQLGQFEELRCRLADEHPTVGFGFVQAAGDDSLPLCLFL